MGDTGKFDQSWWERTWRDRADALWQAFGPSHPQDAAEGYVTSIDFGIVPRPGACIYTFRPTVERSPSGGCDCRTDWLYLTHGLAQWLTRDDMRAARAAGNNASGTGAEFGLLCERPAPWALSLLQWIMEFQHEACASGDRPFERGDRIPFYFERLDTGDELWCIGGADGPGTRPADATRALVFWPYLSPFGTFTTSTGTFDVRIATTITGPEWALAQETSSCHLLLLLDWAGVGQRSITGRRSVTDHSGWQDAWARFENMSFDEAKEALRQIARRKVAS